jgi:hypothetical protein
MTLEEERAYRACCTSGGTEVDPVFAELDATRAALAAAEAKLADERRQLTAALEAERLHADAQNKALHEFARGCVLSGHGSTPQFVVDMLGAHLARRAAEVK